MDKLTVISGCLFLAADIFAIASIANPDWISTGDSAGKLLLTLCPEKVEVYFMTCLIGGQLIAYHWGNGTGTCHLSMTTGLQTTEKSNLKKPV